MNQLHRLARIFLLSNLCFLSFAVAFGASGRKSHTCVSKKATPQGLPYTIEFDVLREGTGKQGRATLVVGSEASDLFVLGEVLMAGKTGFGPTGEDMDFSGDYFDKVTLRFETPVDGAKPRAAFLNLSKSSLLRELFDEDDVPLLCEMH